MGGVRSLMENSTIFFNPSLSLMQKIEVESGGSGWMMMISYKADSVQLNLSNRTEVVKSCQNPNTTSKPPHLFEMSACVALTLP